MKLLLIQGANMEYLGRRQPELYGTTTAKELDALLLFYGRLHRVHLHRRACELNCEPLER